MDSLDFINGVDADDEKKKISATQWYSRIVTISKFFRFAELCFALLLLFWIFARLPLAVGISGGYFRQFAGVLASPLSVFVLCHVIVVSVMANSGRFSGSDSELYDRMVENCAEVRTGNSSSENDAAPIETEEVVFEDKEVISEAKISTAAIEAGDRSDPDSDLPIVFRRWQSEIFERECSEDHHDRLLRSGSEKCLDIVVSGGHDNERHAFENSISHDKLSDEDFNRTVEAFIAKQLRFRRQEHGHGATTTTTATVGLYYRDLGHDNNKAEVSRLCATING
ncbi:tRNA-methyltransferase non-catalytic subunit trm6MTase subunit [Parasponia andersonii]|uniref:tRNA-methyltransferase non-catalytic subunit trm6MTase subunit n=1 Tax=Parasponia andersonii TaxID=3476 RepID=A0A2P5DDT2_PARAD|nr:tRNA-methyltransferase non-catalytic subunit trm6MTase subunit [Parasponia andersonii]